MSVGMEWQELLSKLDKARKEADDNAARLETELVSHRHHHHHTELFMQIGSMSRAAFR